MYEHMTYSTILQRMLDRIPDGMDKRQGSVIYDACAPAAAELAQLYIDLDTNYSLSFVDTASGEYLSRKTAEFGVNRNTATSAVRLGQFFNASNGLMDVPIGTRWAIGSLTYSATQRISLGNFRMTCETVGVIGNQQFGALLPIDFVADLARATLGDVLVPGEDEEADDALRQRFYDAVNEPAFGGNMADYRQTLGALPGIGAVKIDPAWKGGGTVKCTIIASDWSVPSGTLVNEVQTLMDPTINSGQGNGLAPIGHEVTVVGVTGRQINVETTLTLSGGLIPEQVQVDVEAAIAAYLLELRQDWSHQQQLTIRTAQIDARLLSVQGVEDVTGTEINGTASNLTLGSVEVPLMGTVVVNG
jgi:uncharacterized phage protein gp47/JayE